MNKWLALVVLLLSVIKMEAQICNGSLGDPIINITFGSGANPGPSLSAATTSYQFVATDCPQDGFYALRNSTNACFGNTWHSITDHTGNSNGYFMLVNASMEPSAFYLDTVHGLCGNTTYEFAAWILNVLKPTSCGGSGIEPDLTFRIEKMDGTVLQSYNTNKIFATNSPQWKQYGFFFTTPPAATDVILRIINNSQGGCGNDLALDDITFRPCGPQISTSISGTTASFVTVCEGTSQSYTFNGNVSVGFNNPVVQWQQRMNDEPWINIPGAVALSYTRNFVASDPPGNYSFRLAAAEMGNMASPQCRTASTPLIVQVSANPLAAASGNGPACEGSVVTLNATGNNAVWTGPNGFTASGTQVNISNVTLQHNGEYHVTTTNGSCNRYDSTTIVVNPNPVLSTNAGEASICDGDTAKFTVTGADNYTWSPSNGLSATSGSTIAASPKDSMIYTVVGDMAGCKDSALVAVNVITKPTANAGPDRFLMEGAGVQLNGTASGDTVSYYWTPNEHIAGVQSLVPVVTPVSNTAYVLHVVSNAGCGMATDSVKVHVFKKLFVPNAFSPNGDAINDRWTINAIESYPNAKVTVFDRYGHPVFNTERFKGWDGKIKGRQLPAGTYYYVIDLRINIVLSGWLAMLY